MARGAHWGSRVGVDRIVGVIAANGSLTAYAMAALDAGWCARFTALTTKDIKSVRLAWTTPNTPGTVTLRIETIDATTGKPTGTLYDANAVITGIVPATGVQTYTFATLPTTGLTVGTEYALVLITTLAGTTQSLASHVPTTVPARYPCTVLTTATAVTRSTFAEVAGSVPCASFIFDDDTEDALAFIPFYVVANNAVYGASLVAGLKVVTSVSLSIAGVYLDCPIKTGTPAGDLRVRIFDSGNSVVSGTTVILDKDSLSTGASARGCLFLFPAPVTLVADTYRIGFDSVNSVNSSNCWNIRAVSFLSSGSYPMVYRLTTSADGGASWADSTTGAVSAALVLDDFVVASAGAVGPWGMIR